MRATVIIAAATIATLLTVAGDAKAQANRTFVSGSGADTNPCSLASPCRSFAGALAQTNTGGEIVVLDTAGYGIVTINKSVTISNPGGVEAGATATGSQDAVTINAGASSVNVTLKGLALQGAPGSLGSGINWVSGGGRLNVIDCVVKDFGNNGITIDPASGSPFLTVAIDKVTAINNGAGIFIAPQPGATVINYAISHTIASNNGVGINIPNVSGPASSGTISYTHAELNPTAGVSFDPASGELTIVNSVLRYNGMVDLVYGTAGPTLYLYDANTIGHFILQAGALTKSDGTNNILSISGGGTITKVAPQ